MALLFEDSLCSICGKRLFSGEEWIAFTHFINDRNHFLFRFSDSGMHKECFENWPHADEFLKLREEAYRRRISD